MVSAVLRSRGVECRRRDGGEFQAANVGSGHPAGRLSNHETGDVSGASGRRSGGSAATDVMSDTADPRYCRSYDSAVTDAAIRMGVRRARRRIGKTMRLRRLAHRQQPDYTAFLKRRSLRAAHRDSSSLLLGKRKTDGRRSGPRGLGQAEQQKVMAGAMEILSKGGRC